MKAIIFVLFFALSFSSLAYDSIHQHSETSRVFDTLSSLRDSMFPGLVEFRYGESFSLPEFAQEECRTANSKRVTRLLTEYVDSLNEMEVGDFDTVLFKDQMGAILGDQNYTMCVSHSLLRGHERVDRFIISEDGVYKLWLTEIYDD